MPIVIKKKAKAPTPEPIVKPAKKTPGRVMDGMCRAAIKSAPNSIVPWFLMASYLYYLHDMSMLTDGLYDQLAQDMKARWKEIKHQHKHLIRPEHLEAGSMYDLTEGDYPLMTRCAARHLAQGEWGINIDVRFDA